jgi:hypothetical protein
VTSRSTVRLRNHARAFATTARNCAGGATPDPGVRAEGAFGDSVSGRAVSGAMGQVAGKEEAGAEGSIAPASAADPARDPSAIPVGAAAPTRPGGGGAGAAAGAAGGDTGEGLYVFDAPADRSRRLEDHYDVPDAEMGRG